MKCKVSDMPEDKDRESIIKGPDENIHSIERYGIKIRQGSTGKSKPKKSLSPVIRRKMKREMI